MDLWKYVQDLFKAEQESSPVKPFIQEPLVRSELELEDYNLWKRTLAKRRVLDWLNVQYASFVMNGKMELDKTIDFLNTPSVKGFVIYFDEQLHNKKDIIHLFDYLQECVLEMNYKKYMSDTRTYTQTRNNKTWVETIERHYLKPRFKKRDNDTFDQQFGNIKIELLFRDEVIRNLQFSATKYNDRNFSKGDTFHNLIREVLK